MNIPEDILNEQATHEELFCTATGGGLDYVSTHLGEYDVTLGDQNDAGSPDGLHEPATVTIWLTEQWDTGITFQFDTALEGMEFMAMINRIGDTF